MANELEQLRRRVAELEARLEVQRGSAPGGHRARRAADIEARTDALEEGGARYRCLVEDGVDMILEVDSNLDLVCSGERLAKIVGVDPEAGDVRLGMERVHPDDRKRVIEHGRAVLEGERPQPVEFRVQHRDGRWLWFEASGARFETPDGELRILGVMRDATQRKTNEQVMLQSERLASMGILSAGIAHQINNPIGAIMMGSEYALSQETDPVLWRQALAENRAAAQRCGDIVRSLLQFARRDPGSKRTEDLHEIVRRACRSLEDHARSRASSIDLELAPNACLVHANGLQLEQAIANVLANAIESRSRGARVQVRSTLEGDQVALSIQDNGLGIDPRQQALVFDPFYTTRLHEGGVGLGLSVTHGVVLEHAGTIEVESKPNLGSQFTIRLPLDDLV